MSKTGQGSGVVVRQFCSSVLLGQCGIPSHSQREGIQNPPGHLNPQKSSSIVQLFSSDWSEQWGVPSHFNCELMQ